LLSKHIYRGIFSDGVTTEALRYFEETYKIGINIYYIDPRGPQYTRHDYVSMHNNEDHDPIINLGYMEQDNKSHFVLITKLNCLISEKYHSHKKLICTKCNTIFSNREALLNHEKTYHSNKDLPIINLPKPEEAFIKFDITRENDLKKTVFYPLVCYADFEASTVRRALWGWRTKIVTHENCGSRYGWFSCFFMRHSFLNSSKLILRKCILHIKNGNTRTTRKTETRLDH
jgi:hypothetical protein